MQLRFTPTKSETFENPVEGQTFKLRLPNIEIEQQLKNRPVNPSTPLRYYRYRKFR